MQRSAYPYLCCLEDLDKALGNVAALEPKVPYGHLILSENVQLKNNLYSLRKYVLGSSHYENQRHNRRQEKLEQKKLALLQAQIETSQNQVQQSNNILHAITNLLETHQTGLLLNERQLAIPYPVFSMLCAHPQCAEQLKKILKQIQRQEQQRHKTENLIAQQHAELHAVQDVQEHLKNGIHEALASLQDQINQLKTERSVRSPNSAQQISPGAEHLLRLPVSASAPHIHYPNLNSPSLQENKQPEGQE